VCGLSKIVFGCLSQEKPNVFVRVHWSEGQRSQNSKFVGQRQSPTVDGVKIASSSVAFSLVRLLVVDVLVV